MLADCHFPFRLLNLRMALLSSHGQSVFLHLPGEAKVKKLTSADRSDFLGFSNVETTAKNLEIFHVYVGNYR